MRDNRIGLTQKEALALFSGKDPWSKRQKITGEKISHQIDIEIDTIPVAVVAFQNGRMGDDPLYDIGCAFAADGHYTEAVQMLGTTRLELAISACEKLAANPEAVMNLFV
jgi:hypothetical protein